MDNYKLWFFTVWTKWPTSAILSWSNIWSYVFFWTKYLANSFEKWPSGAILFGISFLDEILCKWNLVGARDLLITLLGSGPEHYFIVSFLMRTHHLVVFDMNMKFIYIYEFICYMHFTVQRDTYEYIMGSFNMVSLNNFSLCWGFSFTKKNIISVNFFFFFFLPEWMGICHTKVLFFSLLYHISSIYYNFSFFLYMR